MSKREQSQSSSDSDDSRKTAKRPSEMNSLSSRPLTSTRRFTTPTVVVKKKNGKWRMYVDYTNLNKASPKDPFRLPHIDQVVDSTAGSELLCFLDANSGYHQVSLAESDCIKTSFITPFGAYCYITMPFGLKNAGATYQRAMQPCLHDQLGRIVEAYVDDIII